MHSSIFNIIWDHSNLVFLICITDSLIIASKYHPLPVLKECLPLLGPNSPFVIYSEYMEPLTECYLYAQNRGDCLRMRLCDTWLREYQTLPGRVHPQMFMPVSGGYLLTGVYVGLSGLTGKDARSFA